MTADNRSAAADPSDADSTAQLQAAIAAFPGPGFAVVDGAHFDDLPTLMRRHHLFARSLFLDTADPALQAAGPWLLALDQAPDAMAQVIALVGDKPAVVFWCCDKGESVLWRHLRTLNMAHIPQWAAEGGSEPPQDGSGQEPTAVTFRHFDPRVLGALLPCLDPAGFSRVLGPARELAFCDDSGQRRRVVHDSTWPEARAGLLAMRSDQIQAIAGRRISASSKRRLSYLRTVEPESTRALSDEELTRRLAIYDASAAGLGLKTERSRAQWAYLMHSTEGTIEQAPRVRRYLTTGPGEPEEKMQVMIDRMVHLSQLDRERR